MLPIRYKATNHAAHKVSHDEEAGWKAKKFSYLKV